MKAFHFPLVAALVSASLTACAKPPVQVAIEMPELDPPPPPRRMVERYQDEPVPTIAPGPVEAALVTPPPKTPPRPVSRPEPVKADPEPPPVEPERPPSPPVLTLKPAPGVSAQTEASIRTLLDDAQRKLQRIKYAALNADGRAQFDTARRFMEQADDALRSGNLVFASTLADKASTMASVLVR